MKDKEIKEFLIKGKRLAEKQIDIFNKILRKEEHFGTLPVSIEVTDSTISPLSDRLIMFLISTTTTTGIYSSVYAMSISIRSDLIAHYTLKARFDYPDDDLFSIITCFIQAQFNSKILSWGIYY